MGVTYLHWFHAGLAAPDDHGTQAMTIYFTMRRRIAGALTGLAMTTALIPAAAAPATAHAPGIVGIDHVGINVPDLDQAIAFFHDLFGFEPVTRIGPFKMDAAWKKAYRIHDGADTVSLVMLRAGDGANIELFAYSPAVGGTMQPQRDDIGATHIGLYTTDIDGAKAFLESKGIAFLSGVNAGAGDTEGERWVYFETPWGASFELNSYPNGKAYERRNPAVKLWQASGHSQQE